jgi:purine-binding chemotaxis protein CheW
MLVAFVVDGRRCAIALAVAGSAVPMVAVTGLPGAPPAVLGAISVHGRVVPVFDVRRRLGLPAREHRPSDQLLLATARDRMVALPVDEVLGVVEAEPGAVTSAGAVLPGLEHVSGVVALEDGLLLIHDLDAFLTSEEERLLAPALAEAQR